jgi:HAD superfamily hydrolase (TIGR01509 family)
MKKAALFDMDGVLADTEAAGMKIVADVCRGFGIELTTEEAMSFIGITDEQFFQEVFSKHGSAADAKDHVRSAVEMSATLYEAQLAKGVSPFPGALQLPKRLKSMGWLLGLVSGSTSKQVDVILRQLGLDEVFDVRVTCSDIHSSKPDPEGYLLAAKKLHVSPTQCIVFEDAIPGIGTVRSQSEHPLQQFSALFSFSKRLQHFLWSRVIKTFHRPAIELCFKGHNELFGISRQI